MMDEGDRPLWDAYWSRREQTLMARTMSQVLDRIKLDYLGGILPGGGLTLEVGSGSGRLSCLLAMRGYRTLCLDYSFEALKCAQVNFGTAQAPGHFVAGSGTRLPVADGSVDVVLSTGLLEHFLDPTPIVREMVRVLKPGGVFYSDIVPRKFSLFRSLDWIGSLKRTVTRETIDSLYERAFTRREIENLLSREGLRQVQVFSAGIVPPYVPVLSRFQGLREWEVKFVERTQSFWRWFDGTWVGERLGFYYFAWARKASAA
jgi:SAM-dependent methyltransferase